MTGNNSTHVMTFDVDWAPDWMVSQAIQLCRKYSVPATFFATHHSLILTEIANDPLFELAIHPNFKPGSSHGDGIEAVMEYCMDFAPNAVSLRTHGLEYSSNMIATVAQKYPSLRFDSSLLMPFQSVPGPVPLYFADTKQPLYRVPIYWSDYYACLVPNWNWAEAHIEDDGIVTLLVHPVHLALNTSDLHQYKRLKSDSIGTPLNQLSESDVRDYKNSGDGTASFLNRLFVETPKKSWSHVKDLVQQPY